MKQKWSFFLSLCLLFSGGAVVAGDEIMTQDGKCSFFYPSTKNRQGWYIRLSSPALCANGSVSGQGEVTIYDAFSKPTMQLYGFFSDGVWTGETNVPYSILEKKYENGIYKATFVISQNLGFEAEYIGQMSSERKKDGSYGAFRFCAKPRILVRTDDTTLFSDSYQTEEIINEVVGSVRAMCPQTKNIQLYASDKVLPEIKDIFFFAELDLDKAIVNVKKNTADKVKIAQKVEPVPVAVLPTMDTDETQPLVATEVPEPASPDKSFTFVEKTDSVPDLTLPEQNIAPEEISANEHDYTDKVPHLLTLGRILGHSVSGTAAVEFRTKADGSVYAVAPNYMTVMGDVAPLEGWYMVSGDFAYQSGTASAMKGSITLKSVIPCQEKLCTDIK